MGHDPLVSVLLVYSIGVDNEAVSPECPDYRETRLEHPKSYTVVLEI